MTPPADWHAWMGLALEEAARAASEGEVPVGAILVDEHGVVLARGHNRREGTHDPTAHAEIEVLREAARARGDFRLTGTTLIVTLEPCPMCAGALRMAMVRRVIFGARDRLYGAVTSRYTLLSEPWSTPEVDWFDGVREEESRALLDAFFAQVRGLGNRK